MKRFAVCIGLAALVLLPRLALARTSHVEDTAVDKLTRGLAGMTTGFLELPGNMVAETRDHGAPTGMTIGFAKGLGMIPVRELVGVYEFVTSPVPVPDDYEPILQPEYPWDYFQGARSARFSGS